MTIDPGRLRHSINIVSATANLDAYNQNTQTWTTVVVQTWGEILQLRGVLLQLAQAKTTTAVSTHSITIRYNPNVTEKCRVAYGSTLYSITSVIDPDSTRRWMHLLCAVVKV